jgi:hypothetical protein
MNKIKLENKSPQNRRLLFNINYKLVVYKTNNLFLTEKLSTKKWFS